MDPRIAIARSILILGSVLTILGIGTWALVTGSTIAFILPALFGAGFLLIGGILLKARNWYRQLLWLSVLIATVVVAFNFDAVLEAFRFNDGAPISPAVIQQSVAVLLCSAFICISIRRLSCSQASQ